MSRSRRSNRTRVATIVAAAMLVLGAVTTGTRANETNLTGDAAGTWPTFERTLDLHQPPVTATKIPVAGGEEPVVVSAPLPPAVMTGAFVLGGQWVVSLLWKKRKI